MMSKSIRCCPSLYEILGTTSSGLLVHVYIAHKKHVEELIGMVCAHVVGTQDI